MTMQLSDVERERKGEEVIRLFVEGLTPGARERVVCRVVENSQNLTKIEVRVIM
jgi:hypothetical protein